MEGHDKFCKDNLLWGGTNVSSQSMLELIAYSSRNTVFIADMRAKHIPNGFLISEGNLISFVDEVEAGISNIFEPFKSSTKTGSRIINEEPDRSNIRQI